MRIGAPRNQAPNNGRVQTMPTSTIERDVHVPADAGAKSTRRQGAERGVKAPKELTDSLQQVLVDLIELHVQGKQAHWNVVGKNFRDLHLQLDEIIDSAREFSDTIAERMRALYITPDGRAASVAEQSSLPAYPEGEVDTAETVDLITERLYA